MTFPIPEVARYGLNGLLATGAHFAALTFNLNVLGLPSAGLANLLAAVIGVTSSFLGSRYFVFSPNGKRLIPQAVKFAGLYGVIAVLHGLTLLVWTDWWGLDYRIGFLVATTLQVSLSYVGNKYVVFRA